MNCCFCELKHGPPSFGQRNPIKITKEPIGHDLQQISQQLHDIIGLRVFQEFYQSLNSNILKLIVACHSFYSSGSRNVQLLKIIVLWFFSGY